MRLFLSDHEVRLIRAALTVNMRYLNEDDQDTAQKIIERMKLCEELQNNERKAKQ